MPHRTSDLKDLRGGASLNAAPPPSAVPSESADGEMDFATTPRRKPARSSQVSESNQPTSGITHIQYRRIVASLAEGHAERNIAEAEHVPEHAVRRVRAAEIDRLTRQMSAVGIAFSGFLENVKVLHRDIDQSVIEDLREQRVA